MEMDNSQDADWEQQQELEEKLAIENYIRDMKEKNSTREKYKKHHANVADFRPDESAFFKLDSSLKKNTAFVRKLKIFTESQKESVLKDIKSLNLTKYVSEVASAITETKLKMSDISAVVEICCLLHERYADFSDVLLDRWKVVLLQKKDDKVTNQSKFRVDLRLFAELISVGVLPEKAALAALSNQLNILINYDKEEHLNISIIQSFCKHCGNDYAALIPRKYQLLLDKFNLELTLTGTLPPEKQKACRKLLKEYYESVKSHLLEDHRELKHTEYQNKKILHTKGELSHDRQERYDSMLLAYNKLLSNVQSFSDVIGEDAVELPEHKFGPDPSDSEFSSLAEFQFNGDTSLYEDEETQQFYEKLLDVRSLLPQIMLKDSPKDQETKKSEGKEEGGEKNMEEVEAEMERESEELADTSSTTDQETGARPESIKEEPPEHHEPSVMASTNKLLFEKFLHDLPNCVNRELIDRAAQDFCMSHNTKSHRKKLAKTLFGVARTRYDLLPFYARFVATLHSCTPDLTADLCQMLEADFRWHVRKKDQINIESKLKVTRFIGELTKFKMFPKKDSLGCLRILLMSFSHHAIDMACAFLETCGRFLYRSEDSQNMTRIYLEMMLKKKRTLNLDPRYDTMIENAFYTTNPPNEESVVRGPTRPPLHEYIRRLLYKDLNKYSVEKVVKQLRKLSWKEPELRTYVTRSLTDVWNMKYASIHYMAAVVTMLSAYYDDVAVQVVDGVLEDIRLGMEINLPTYNQRRVALVRYLGELYNYKMADSTVIVKTLYSFITFGVSYELDVATPLDTPGHLFRLRLVCELLETCGTYFDRGSHKKKLDYFLVYLQRYFWYKKALSYWDEDFPFPVTVDMMVRDTLERLRPKTKFPDSYMEAVKNCDTLNSELLEKIEAEHLKIQLSNQHQRQRHLQTLKLLLGNRPVNHPQFMEEQPTAPDEGLPVILEEEGMTEDGELMNQSQQSTHEETLSLTQTGDGSQTVDAYGDSQTPPDPEDGRSRQVAAIMSGLSQESEDELDTQEDEEEVEASQPARTIGPKFVQCAEDDEFQAAFDRMMMDNITSRSLDHSRVQQTDISVPSSFRQQSKKPFTTIKGSMLADTSDEQEHKPLKFALMLKKGNKATFTPLDLDVSKQFVSMYKEREAEEKAEKEKLKKLVLENYERQEEEEQALLVAGKSPLPNTNREKKVKYSHPKGAPDADLIFGSGPKSTTKR